MTLSDRTLVVAAAACGLAGVAFSAIATHQAAGTMATGATFLLFHAPVFLAIGLVGLSRMFRIAALVLLAGVALFCTDLIIRPYGFARLFPMAAPAGGILMMLGWFALGCCALFVRAPGTRLP